MNFLHPFNAKYVVSKKLDRDFMRSRFHNNSQTVFHNFDSCEENNDGEYESANGINYSPFRLEVNDERSYNDAY